MILKRMLLLAFPAAGLASEASAQAAASYGMQESMMGSMLRSLIDRLDQILASLPALGAYLSGLTQQFGGRETGLLIGIVAGGLAVEWLARTLLQRARVGIFERHAGESPLRAFFHGALLDACAVLALWLAARFVAGQVGAPDGVHGRLAQQILLALLYWRGF